MDSNLTKNIEALIFASEEPINIQEIKRCLDIILEADILEFNITQALEQISQKYADNSFVFEIKQSGGGYQFMTKPTYHQVISIFSKQKANKKLSRAAMECLAIVAYKQPITKAEVEKIRGVNCDYTMQKLLEKELVVIAGRSDSPGKPLIYATSPQFMDHFGINSINDLPKLKDIQQEEENSIGEEAEK